MASIIFAMLSPRNPTLGFYFALEKKRGKKIQTLRTLNSP